MMAGAPGCPVITVNPATLPPGVIGTPYSQTAFLDMDEEVACNNLAGLSVFYCVEQ